MKHITITLLLAVVSIFSSRAQVCTPINLNAPGSLSPVQDSLICIERGVPYDETIYFQNFNTVPFGGNNVTVQWIKFDSILNLPCGIQWAVNRADRKYMNSEIGCIRILGTTNDAVGQYDIHLWVTANVGVNIPSSDATGYGFGYTVRVIDSAGACLPVDTNDAGNTASCKTTMWNGVSSTNDLKENVQSVFNYPNPFSSKTEITFLAVENKLVDFRVYNALGAVVYSEPMDITRGKNVKLFDAEKLPDGIYYYNIDNSPMQKMIVVR